MNRRRVLQIGLLLAAQAVLPTRADPSLTASVRLEREGELWAAHVELLNQSGEPLDILVSLGDGPGVTLTGKIGQVVLEPIQLEPVRLSRAAPRRVWRPLPAHGKMSLGRYNLRPSGPVPENLPASFSLNVATRQGEVRLAVDGVPVP